MSDDDEKGTMLWAKLAEFEAESVAGDLAHRDVLWLNERVRQDYLVLRDVRSKLEHARAQLLRCANLGCSGCARELAK